MKHLLFALVVLVAQAGTAQKQTYKIEAIPGFDGRWSIAKAINNAGEVVGIGSKGGAHRGFVWSSGLGTRELSFCTDATLFDSSAGYDINDSGVIVGYVSTGYVGMRSALWNARTEECRISSDADSSSGRGVSPDGRQVGESSGRPFLQNGSLHEALPTFDGPDGIGVANAMNSSTTVVGSAMKGGWQGLKHAFVVRDDTIQDLTPTALIGEAFDVSELGTVVGYYSPAPSKFVAFKWTQASGLTTLGSLARNGGMTAAYGVNTLGHVVGESAGRAFLHQGNKLIDLNSTIPSNSGWSLAVAYGINDLGQIVGYGFLNGVQTAFVLTPR